MTISMAIQIRNVSPPSWTPGLHTYMTYMGLGWGRRKPCGPGGVHYGSVNIQGLSSGGRRWATMYICVGMFFHRAWRGKYTCDLPELCTGARVGYGPKTKLAFLRLYQLGGI